MGMLGVCVLGDSVRVVSFSTSSAKVQGFGLVSLWTAKKSCDLTSAPGPYIE